MLLKSLAAWASILCLAIANGALREAVLIPTFGRTGGLVLSGLLLCLLVGAVAHVLVRFTPGITIGRSLLVGVLWVCLTVAFEFGFGRLVQDKPWAELFAAYAFKDGNLWPLVLLVTAAAPCIATLRAREPFGSDSQAPPSRR